MPRRKPNLSEFAKRRMLSLVSMGILVPIGFYTKFYQGPASVWVNGSLGGVFYEIFWSLLAYLLWPKWRPVAISCWVCGVTCFLEFTQAWHPPFLEEWRSHFLIRTVIGSTFDWYDFLYYFIGSFLAWMSLRAIEKA